MKRVSPKLIVLLLALLWPVGHLWSAPSRFSEPANVAQDEPATGEVESIARETGDADVESAPFAKPVPPPPIEPTASPPAGEQDSNLAQSLEEAEPGEVIAEGGGSEAGPLPENRMTTISDAVLKDESLPGVSDNPSATQDENVEWVGKDRRIKRVKQGPTNIYLKSRKPPGRLIITDDYHPSATELLGTADVRHYGARPEESQWLYSGSKFLCELRHEIPGFGYAVMKQGVEAPLEFVVESDVLLGGSGQARIQSRPPQWKRFTLVKDLGTVMIEPKDNALFSVSREWVKRLILELREGMQPTISFWDDDTGGEDVVLTLSSFNFQKQLPEFSRCLGQLLPYSFKDVRKRTVYFGYDKYALTPEQHDRLNKLIEYVKLDETVKRVDIIGFSDSVGFARYNRTLAERRANAVKKYLLAQGLPSDKLVVKAKGEKGKKHSNRTASGRSKNRRVEVTLIK